MGNHSISTKYINACLEIGHQGLLKKRLNERDTARRELALALSFTIHDITKNNLTQEHALVVLHIQLLPPSFSSLTNVSHYLDNGLMRDCQGKVGIWLEVVKSF